MLLLIKRYIPYICDLVEPMSILQMSGHELSLSCFQDKSKSYSWTRFLSYIRKSVFRIAKTKQKTNAASLPNRVMPTETKRHSSA